MRFLPPLAPPRLTRAALRHLRAPDDSAVFLATRAVLKG